MTDTSLYQKTETTTLADEDVLWAQVDIDTAPADRKVTWANIKAYFLTHALATAANDFLIASGAGVFIKKTLTETLTILGKAVASGLASLNASSLVVQNPANATTTPTASKIPIAGDDGILAAGWFAVAKTVKRNVGSIFGSLISLARPYLRNGAYTDSFGISFIIPSNYASGDITLNILVRGEEAVAAANIYFSARALSSWVNSGGENVIIASDTQTITMGASAAATLISYTLPAASVAQSCVYHYLAVRDGNNASDTYTADVTVLGAWLSYTGTTE